MNNNDYKKKVKTLYSWPVIIIFIIVFWPFGMYLIYKRININKKRGFARYISYFCFLMTAVGILVTLTSSDNTKESIAPTILFFVVGVALFRLSKKLAFKAEKYEKYTSIITNEKQLIIDNIAEAMSLPTNVVRKDLNDMINNEYFQGAYINNSTNEIVLPQQSKGNINETTPNYESKIEAKVVTCKCCGAQNKITTSVVECEYCGSPL
ncbi:hypothetical protein [Clostridium peptidivorans]|uniref:hypothetical protein n=1 Tax=Clostridium peptidivorans TaxID=100174 RepID=UPI000BE41904|nr:hypothetical protein [Clostridium peptidivorans]